MLLNRNPHFVEKFVKEISLFFLCLLMTMVVTAQIRVGHLFCENKPESMGVDAMTPRLSWQMEWEGSMPRGILQTAYEIMVAEGSPDFKHELVWSSGKLSSDRQVQIPYEGKPLASGQVYYWQVRVWDNNGVTLRVNGKAGDSVKLYHAEVLDKSGNFYTDNLRRARQEDVYVLKGGEMEEFEPHFSWQGFCYVRVVGFPGELKKENLDATALYSDMPLTGQFECSNVLLNQLQHNITWGQRGNFLDVPTDCPQRDERLGWTGDAQVFCRTAAFNRQVNNFFAKWLQDVAADQFPGGAIPHVVPNVLGKNDGGSAGWSDVATIVPWTMYLV